MHEKNNKLLKLRSEKHREVWSKRPEVGIVLNFICMCAQNLFLFLSSNFLIYVFDFSLLFTYYSSACFLVYFPTLRNTWFMNMLQCMLNTNTTIVRSVLLWSFSWLCFSVFQLQWTICPNEWISSICFVWYCCFSHAWNMCFHVYLWAQFWKQ